MEPVTPPPCPRCARNDVQLLSQRPAFLASDPYRTRPYATTFVFKCQCGLAFTHDEPTPNDQPQTA